MQINIKHDNTRDKSNESSQSHERINASKPQTTNERGRQRSATGNSIVEQTHLCATIAQHHSCKHRVLCALNHIRIGSASLQRAFALDNRKRHEISDTQAHYKRNT